MQNTNVLVLGGSKNIGYHTAMRLLGNGATVTFLLRNPSVFDHDEAIKTYVTMGSARLVKGDALNPQDVANAWTKAAEGENSRVDFVIFSIGATQASISLTKGLLIEPRNLCSQSVLNLLCTMPKSEPQPNFVFVTSTGITKTSHDNLPWLMKPLYSWGLQIPHADKLGAERVIHHCAAGAEEWADSEPSLEVTERDGVAWREREGLPSPGELKNWVILRPALLLDGACKAEEQEKKGSLKEPYKIVTGDLGTGPTISRRDVAHFLVEGLVKNWDKWQGKVLNISY